MDAEQAATCIERTLDSSAATDADSQRHRDVMRQPATVEVAAAAAAVLPPTAPLPPPARQRSDATARQWRHASSAWTANHSGGGGGDIGSSTAAAQRCSDRMPPRASHRADMATCIDRTCDGCTCTADDAQRHPYATADHTCSSVKGCTDRWTQRRRRHASRGHSTALPPLTPTLSDTET